jgi:hypothetical protein
MGGRAIVPDQQYATHTHPPSPRQRALIESTKFLVVHGDAFAREQDLEPSIAEPPANAGKIAQASPHCPIVRSGCCDSGPTSDPLQLPSTPAVR